MWAATANKRKERPVLQGRASCDVVIIGGGFTGLSTAYHLQQNGCQTIVLEKESAAFGASGRNGGEVLTGFAIPMSKIAKSKGIKTAKQMFRLSLDAVDLVEAIIHKHRIKCDFKKSGAFIAAAKPSHLESLKKEQEILQRDFNYPVKIIEKKDLETELRTSYYCGGSVDENSAHFHPLNYALGLAEAAEVLGASIYEHSEVLKIHHTANRKVVVTTDRGQVTARAVVIATNAYSGPLNRNIQKSVVPVESIMIATEPLSEELMESLIKKNRAVYDTKHLLFYFRRTADNRLAFGGSGSSYSKQDWEKRYANLHRGMLDVFPELKNVRIEYQWGGKVGFARERLPQLGQLDDGTHFAFGFAGHGAALTTMAGKLIAESIINGGDVTSPLRKESVRPFPFFSQHAKAVGIMKLYYQWLDRVSR
ncbi:FAD-binding oxidoreductase [Sporolactobacillus sp. THM7-7]|nr:FAD-binding oxidoreductase [Sporolactobacillus sp. THM7-7]